MSPETAQTVGSIAFAGLLVTLAGLSSQAALGNVGYRTKLLLFWLIFDALIHVVTPLALLMNSGATILSTLKSQQRTVSSKKIVNQ
ncbi:hypothetical protein MEQU1_000770 [Malassezia equina]|uniref:Uncharacterized protein n=1 Tax=Malassezia equina TaxID=1381935 RepID=A0AAF0EAE6_9BASI|nr:hypothetical protein MEQU1_000770 [Malassezia equina]